MSDLRQGVVEYLERAFEQDSAEAIRGDVIRALIELITNSDDAYPADSQLITVVIERQEDDRYPFLIRVQDQALGLTADEMISNFAVLGREKILDGQSARGLFGRGAKDVATLGEVRFKAIRDGKYSELLLDHRGHWAMLAEDSPATAENRSDLGLQESDNGLTVELSIRPGITVPSRLKLQDRISGHAQLRDLVQRQHVVLIDNREKNAGPAELQAPENLGQMIINEDIPVAGYDPVRLTVQKLPQRGSGNVGPYSSHGLIVKSGVSTFENSWFDLDNRQEAAFFSGAVEAPQISEVIRAYDKGDSKLGGPTRLLSRSRDGLIKEHPYRKALSAAVTTRVKPLFDDLAKDMDANKRQGEELNQALKVAREALREQIRDLLEEIDESDEGPDDEVIAPLALIPPRRVAAPNETLTFTVRATSVPIGTLIANVDHAHPPETVASLAVSETNWVPHPRLAAFQKTIYATAGSEEGSAALRVQVDGLSASATVIVREPLDSEYPLPETLEVLPETAHIAPNRRKRLALRAPIALEGVDIGVSCDPNVATAPEYVTLRSEPGGRWSQATVPIVAGSKPAKIPVHLWGAEQSVTAHVVVEDIPMRGGLDWDFELSGYRKPFRRSELVPEGGLLKLRVFPLHPSFDGVFGRYSDADQKFSNEDSVEARAILAELIASELAGYFTERDYDKRPDRFDDAPRVLRRRAEISIRLLPALHRSLRPQK